MSETLKQENLTGQIIKAFYEVYNVLGYGFLETVYEQAMEIELKRLGLQAERQAAIKVHYRNQVVGKYFADLLVEDAVIVELKTVKSLGKEHEAQLLNYLKSTSYEVGLLLNFGPKATFMRKVLDNVRKGNLSWTKKQSTNE